MRMLDLSVDVCFSELGANIIEDEFLAGGIALRFLNDPNLALKHFLWLRRIATSSKSIALGEYWLGRTGLELGDRGSAMVHFYNAAKYPQYFYGQLGRQSLDAKPAHLEITRTPVPTEADIQRSEEHTSELQSLMRISYAGFCLHKKKRHQHALSLLHIDNNHKTRTNTHTQN